MAELAATPEAQAKFRQIGSEQVAWLANLTDQFGQRVTMPREFVIPGDTLADAALDMARTAVRRTERCVSRLVAEGVIENADLLGYLNRLSSLLFVLGRYVVARTGQDKMTFAKRELPENVRWRDCRVTARRAWPDPRSKPSWTMQRRASRNQRSSPFRAV